MHSCLDTKNRSMLLKLRQKQNEFSSGNSVCIRLLENQERIKVSFSPENEIRFGNEK